MNRFTSLASRYRRVSPVLGLGLFLLATPAHAAIAWHDDLPTARAAGAASGKPVLAIFVASWSPEAERFREQTLASPEVTGLLEACFEATLVDVDAEPALARRMQVSHVPSACIFGEKGPPLASFECSEQPLAFIAAATKAAQEAAATRALAAVPAAAAAKPADLSAAGFPASPGDGDPLARTGAAASSSNGSISLVTAKVRQLSDFATGVELHPAPSIAPTSDAASMIAAAPTGALGSRGTPDPLAGPPALATTPPSWPAERPAAAPTFTNVPQPATARPGIEPAADARAVAATPWLSTPPPAAAVAADEPATSATATDLPVPAGAKSTWSSFMAAMTKPFAKATPQASPPPTMPPARPAAPLAEALTTAISPPPALGDSAPADDHYGSMPLGLEGYCPVTVADRGVWTEGRAQWGVRHRGRTYLFAGPEQQQAFLAAPDRYAPVLSGDDPVVVCDQGRSTPGRRAFGVTYQSRMYLFSSSETRAAFAANPDRYTSGVMLAERPAPVDATRRY